jgi:predicted RNase H-like nuclease (RuvC/YqgF family)|tara:strand:- start:379 stop:585 length:207 start_codon:yes stop_codon:yes gene_type:complete
MNEQDLQYLLKAYQDKTFDLTTQSVALQAKINKLTDVNAELGKRVQEQQEEIKKLETRLSRRKSNETS